MINVLLEPSPNPGESLPLVTVHIPDEDTGTALSAIWWTQHSVQKEREAIAGIPTTNHTSEDPTANPLSERERHYDNISDQLLSNQGWFVSHTVSDTRRNLDTKAPDGVKISYDRRKLGTVCLQAICTGVGLAFEYSYPPVFGANLPKIPYIGKALGALFNVANQEATRSERVKRATIDYLNRIMTIRVVTPEEAAYIRDIGTYEDKRQMEETASIEQAQREAEWLEESKRLGRELTRQHLANTQRVAFLRQIVRDKRAAQTQE